MAFEEAIVVVVVAVVVADVTVVVEEAIPVFLHPELPELDGGTKGADVCAVVVGAPTFLHPDNPPDPAEVAGWVVVPDPPVGILLLLMTKGFKSS